MGKIFTIAALITIGLALAIPETPQAKTCPGTPYKWKSLPVEIQIGPSLNMEQEIALRSAATMMEAQVGMKLFKLIPYDGKSKPTNLVSYLPSWTGKNPNFNAQTNFRWNSGYIYVAKIEINGAGIPFFTGPAVDAHKISLESVLIHELAHVLGILHNKRETSIMQEGLAMGVIRTKMDSEDIELIQCIYRH